MPHVPIAASDKFKGKSEQGTYGDVIMEIDWSVGEIVEALAENGFTDNTLVIFTSDNGPWLFFGDHAGSAGGLREGKGTSFEGGTRVPCIMKWPGTIPPGTICNQLASTIDIYPTTAYILDLELPDRIIDGVNILPLMKGEPKTTPRKEFYYYYGNNNLEVVRSGNWKLIFPHTHRTYQGLKPGTGGSKGETATAEISYALFNLRRDPGERYNVFDYYPEKVTELKELASIARADLGDHLQGVEDQNIRPAGEVSILRNK